MAVLTVMLAQAQGYVCGSVPESELISNNKLQTATLSQNNDLGDLRAWIPYCNEEPLKIRQLHISMYRFTFFLMTTVVATDMPTTVKAEKS